MQASPEVLAAVLSTYADIAAEPTAKPLPSLPRSEHKAVVRHAMRRYVEQGRDTGGIVRALVAAILAVGTVELHGPEAHRRAERMSRAVGLGGKLPEAARTLIVVPDPLADLSLSDVEGDAELLAILGCYEDLARDPESKPLPLTAAEVGRVREHIIERVHIQARTRGRASSSLLRLMVCAVHNATTGPLAVPGRRRDCILRATGLTVEPRQVANDDANDEEDVRAVVWSNGRDPDEVRREVRDEIAKARRSESERIRDGWALEQRKPKKATATHRNAEALRRAAKRRS